MKGREGKLNYFTNPVPDNKHFLLAWVQLPLPRHFSDGVAPLRQHLPNQAFPSAELGGHPKHDRQHRLRRHQGPRHPPNSSGDGQTKAQRK